jgi:hypothetical protein
VVCDIIPLTVDSVMPAKRTISDLRSDDSQDKMLAKEGDDLERRLEGYAPTKFLIVSCFY